MKDVVCIIGILSPDGDILKYYTPVRATNKGSRLVDESGKVVAVRKHGEWQTPDGQATLVVNTRCDQS